MPLRCIGWWPGRTGWKRFTWRSMPSGTLWRSVARCPRPRWPTICGPGRAAAARPAGGVNLAAPAWLREVAAGLDKGFILTIDYGDSAARLYSALRPQGTLLGYTGGRVTKDVYAAPGETDLTAHVDFTTLEQTGQALGLATVAATRQMEFLVALGLGEAFAAIGATPARDRAAVEAALARRHASSA